MAQNYFTIAWRHLGRNKGYTAINIAGLATGMAIALLIGLWVTDELNFDHYAPDHSRLARGMVNSAAQGQVSTGEYVSMAMGEALRSRYSSLFTRTALICGGNDQLISNGENNLQVPALWAQKELAEMFGFRLIQGGVPEAKDPGAALISQSLATSLFGHADPIGRPIKLNNSVALKVCGVYEDLPYNTTFYRIQVILPWYNAANNYHNSNTDWEDHNGALYVELAPGVTAEQASARIHSLPTAHVSYCTETAFVYPIDKWHLYGEFKDGLPSGGTIRFVRLFSIIGVFVLLLACINFMNLSTARSEKRAKEVGIRKTIGSLQTQLVMQFLSESVVLALVALALALALAGIALPFFNALSAKDMHLPWTSPLFILGMPGFAVITGLIAGSYPAFYLSAFRPIKVLKGSFRATRDAAIPRQILVVLQFTVSLSLIIGTVIVYRQILFAKDRPIGYNREGLFTVDINTPELMKHFDALRGSLIASGLVSDAGASSMKPTYFEDANPIDWRGKTRDQNSIGFQNVSVSPAFGHTIGWTIAQGHDFSGAYSNDTSSAILNESAEKIIGIKNPVGETIKFFGKPYTVIGVAKDMVTNSPYEPVHPAVFFGDPYYSAITVRIRPGVPVHQALAGIEPVFKQYNPGSPFVYHFVDEDYAAKFAAEERVGNLAAFFTVLAIFISCLGLFGLASFVAEQRRREISIRKVLGARVVMLWGMLSMEFVRLVAISLLIAIPLSRWIMGEWLLNYTYRSSMPWWLFAAASTGILFVTLATVSYQALKAAFMNPTKNLRAE
ncbi:MAG TPA: ABC transporter permease [Puia sp.]|jgi:ABC-type antimicrobial peptide transport system permease subunit|nr:ABC transporter permease [Puia sp.]